MKRFAPDFILINQGMPDENGWLISSKLRLAQFPAPVWLYAGGKTRSHAGWKKLCGVDEVFAYDDALDRLVVRVRERLDSWLACAQDASHPVQAATVIAACGGPSAPKWVAGN